MKYDIKKLVFKYKDEIQTFIGTKETFLFDYKNAIIIKITNLNKDKCQ